METRVQAAKIPAAAPAAHFNEAPQQPLAVPPFATLQRKCACGGTGDPGGDECEDCKKKQALQRRATAQAGVSTGPAASRVNGVTTRPGQPLGAAPGLREPRWGHDFARVQVHSGARPSMGLRVTEANDPTETEAEGIAGRLVPPGGGAREGAAPSPVFRVIQRVPSTAPSAATVEGGTVGVHLEHEISGAAAHGQPLGTSTRAFFESRLGRDFGKVRIHSGPAAAAVSAQLQADAFTVGNDIFFNRGRYEPASREGLKLLAHELVHVVQQGAGTAAQRLVQRAKISYRALTWADFKATPPSGSSFAAETASGFDVPGWTPKQDAVDTKKACTSGTTKSTEFKATVKVDPAVYDSVAAHMTQEKSWVQARYKDDGKAWCANEAKDCEKDFTDRAAQSKKDCKQEADKCTAAFKTGSTSYTLTVGSTAITATSAAECTSKVQPGCEKAQASGASPHELNDASGTTFASANTKDECKKGFLDNCKTHEAAESAYLLKHEQGHFDISNVMANKARPSLKAKAATFTATETRCGKVDALNAAIASFNAMNASTELNKLGSDWQDSEQKAETDYDNDTNHGLKKPDQAAWEAKIAAGLTAYNPTAKPAAPAQGAPQNPPANPPANPPPQNPPATPPPATP